MWITVHMNLTTAVVGSVVLLALGYGLGWARNTRRKRK